MQTLRPYIGITDFTTAEQVRRMRDVFNSHMSSSSRHQLHVGVMMSRKTLTGEETKWAKVFPPKAKVADIFWCDETYNCLHYADSETEPNLAKNLSEAIFWGGVGIHAVQLDLMWPYPDQVADGIRRSRRKVEVILQIGQCAFDAVGNNMNAFVDKLSEYDGVIDRVLLDKSMGRGVGMDALGLLPYAQKINSCFPSIGIGVAGGLGPTSMQLVEPLVGKIANLSIDAQGKLRPSGDALNEPIDWSMAERYLIEACKMLK